MELKLKWLYRNLNRPAVDNLFKKKENIINEIEALKREYQNTEVDSIKKHLQQLINAKTKSANEYDTKARKLWNDIKAKSETL